MVRLWKEKRHCTSQVLSGLLERQAAACLGHSTFRGVGNSNAKPSLLWGFLEMSRRTRRKTGAYLQRVVGSQWPALPAEPSCRKGTRRAQCKTPGRAQGLHMHCLHQHYMNCSRAVRSFTSAAHHCHPSGKYASVMFWEQPPSACPEVHKP